MKNPFSFLPFTLISKRRLATLKTKNTTLEHHCHLLATAPFGGDEDLQQKGISRTYFLQAMAQRLCDSYVNRDARYPYQEQYHVERKEVARAYLPWGPPTKKPLAGFGQWAKNAGSFKRFARQNFTPEDII